MAKFAEWLRGLSHISKDGSEVPDPTPVALPVGFERPESIQETIRRLVLDPQIRAEFDGKDIESFDDADDFDIPDDVPQSPHEESFDPLHLLAREQEIRAGTVAPRSPGEIAAASKAIADYRASHAPKPAPLPAPVTA